MNKIGFNLYGQSNNQPNNDPWQTSYCRNATIFGKHTFLPINMQQQFNDNTLVIGTSGTGKTYSFVEPNVLQGNANYVIADAKGDILKNTGVSLKKMGYQIQVLNLVDLKHSLTYNPLVYLKNQIDVMHFANTVTNFNPTSQKGSSDPFWDSAASSLLQAIILFTKEFLPASQQTMTNINNIFRLINQRPDQINTVLTDLKQSQLSSEYNFLVDDEDEDKNLGNYLFSWAEAKNPNSQAVKIWHGVTGSQGSEKTWASIVGILGADLERYSLSEVENLMNSNQIDFRALLKPKTALFILYDDADSSKNFISNTLYTQLFEFLYHVARKTDNKLPVKVRFFLDDFKNIIIPGFDDSLATARSRNISICMMLQDESQLQAKFGSNTPSVIGNCAAYLLTGTTDLNMAAIAAKRFNRDAQSIRLMDSDHFLLDVGGHLTSPIRYDFHKHPNYINKEFDINQHFNTPVVQMKDSNALLQIMQHLPGEQRADEEKQIDSNDLDDLINFRNLSYK